MSIDVIKPGALSTFQDNGRYGFQKLGVPVCGPMDMSAHRLANMLVGNAGSLPTLEITLLGPTLRFNEAACVAVAGARLGPRLNDEPLAIHRPYMVRAGDVIRFSNPESGSRSYLAVHGGFDLQPELDSCSTYIKGRLGGQHGRALKAGDRIGLNVELDERGDSLDRRQQRLWDIVIYLPATLGLLQRSALKVIKGPQWRLFTDESISDFLTEPFRISLQSDRMGYRIHGPRLAVRQAQQILSEATAFGAIQVPQGGDPIIIMADRQTMGGYPKIAYVASVDLPALAQRKPTDELSFRLVSIEEAQQLDQDRERAFHDLAASLGSIKPIISEGAP